MLLYFYIITEITEHIFHIGPELPQALFGPRMASLPYNRLLLTGGFSGDLRDEVVKN